VWLCKSCVHGEAGQLLNPSSRMMISYIRQTMLEMTTSKKRNVTVVAKTGCHFIEQPNALFDEWRVMNPIGNKQAPKHTTRFICAKAGSPTGATPMATEPPYEISMEQCCSRESKGAAHEDGPECVIDTHAKGRYQEVAHAWRYAKCRKLKSY
jgi:hypothetical protein